jgi:hypothetical protein
MGSGSSTHHDASGLPVVMDEWIHDLLQRFAGGAVASDVISAFQSVYSRRLGFDAVFSGVAFLEEKGPCPVAREETRPVPT